MAVSVLTEDGGLFGKAKNAGDAYEKAAQDENATISNLMNTVDKYLNDLPKGEEKTKIDVAVVSSNEISVTVPEGLENIVEYEYYINGELASKIEQSTYTNSALEPDTEYTVYVILTDSNGKKYYSETVKVKTKARTYLYQGSRETDDECVDITGGWTGIGITDVKTSTGNAYTAYVPSVTKGEITIYSQLYPTTQMWAIGAVCTVNMIDLSNYSKLVVDIYARATAGSWVQIMVASERDKYQTILKAKRVIYDTVATEFPRGIVEMDISDIDQSAYIQINYAKGYYNTGNYACSTLYNAWLE